MSDFGDKLREEIADGEHWLAGFEMPEPSRESVERVKGAVLAELGKVGADVPADRWTRWHGVAAAAASIALAVGVGWYSARHNQSAIDVLAQDEPASAWSDETWQDAVALGDLDDELADLESWTSEDAWDVDGVMLYEALDGMTQDVTEAQDDVGASIRRSSLGNVEEV